MSRTFFRAAGALLSAAARTHHAPRDAGPHAEREEYKWRDL